MAAAIAAACASTHGGGDSPGGTGGADAGAGGSSADSGSDVADGSDAWSWGGGGNTGGGIGYVCDAGGFWPCTYNPACTPIATAPADHDAYTKSDCRSCHGPEPDAGAPDSGADAAMGPGTPDASVDAASDSGATDSSADASDSGAPMRFLFGGRVRYPLTNVGDPKIEVAVGDGNLFYYTCTDDNGFFFIPASAGPEPNWSGAETHLRSAVGEKIMPTDKPHGPGCNAAPDCHGDPQHPLYGP